ncbi:hypothetical protein WUBG_08482 [Wuchereria bancrofti]|uniref:Uncharacterized protein n=1 Tax=Wuchereria bancrofti TaxID=6293 RepID=J9B167_WUCBA|nr:hypothetical protein WUBG_08482 [Wuchereria bancrofti]VDM12540.1 unnamed protein product [Wuchereria bancrofti]
MAYILLFIFLSLHFTSAQLTSDPGLAFEVIGAEAQDDKVNVTEYNDQKATANDQPNVAHQHDHHGGDEAIKEHGKSEPKLLRVRATVEDEQTRQNETETAENHPKEVKAQKDEKPEITTATETVTTKLP